MPHITSVPETKQQVVDMRDRMQQLHDSPSSGPDTRKSAMRNVRHCDNIIAALDAAMPASGS